MANVTSLQIFFLSYRSERDIIDAWVELTKIKVESIEHPLCEAIGFVQFTVYTEGFSQGALISWPSETQLPVTETELVEQLARKLKTTVLLESIAKVGIWLTALGTSSAIETTVKYLDDGIEVLDRPADEHL